MARAAPAASRAVSIVSFLTAHSSRGFTISELVNHLGLNIASAHATLAVLQDAGFVLRDPVHRTYVLGPALAATGFAALEQHPAVGAAVDQAEILAEEFGAEVGVTAIAGRDLIFLARRGPAPPATTIGYPGDRSPFLAPFGAVFMAWAGEDAVSAWLERAEVRDEGAGQLHRALAEIRARGFSVPLQGIAAPQVMRAMERVRSEPTDEEAEHQLTGVLQQNEEMLLLFDGLSPGDEVRFKTVAAPIFDEIGRVVLSISVTGPDQAVPLENVMRLGRRVAQAAAIATRQGRGRAPAADPPTRVPSRRTG
jgi:DNA-binding IclR family transcriptional regulator